MNPDTMGALAIFALALACCIWALVAWVRLQAEVERR